LRFDFVFDLFEVEFIDDEEEEVFWVDLVGFLDVV